MNPARALFSAAALLAANVAHPAPPLELKGIRPGMTQADLIEKFRGLECSAHPRQPASAVCTYRSKGTIAALDTFADLPADWRFSFREGALVEVSARVNQVHAPRVKAALFEKFGPAKHGDSHWEEGPIKLMVVTPPDTSIATIALFISDTPPQPTQPDAQKRAKDL